MAKDILSREDTKVISDEAMPGLEQYNGLAIPVKKKR
jgi:hypothetical protein